MTSLRYWDKDDHVRISIHGHAGYNPGNDIVCAGISAITYEMLNTLNAFAEAGKVYALIAEAVDGNVTADFRVADRPAWDIAWMVIRIGYENIAQAYPQNLWFEDAN